MTIIDILNTIPDLTVRKWAVNNVRGSKRTIQSSSISEALLNGFVWGSCQYPEGVSPMVRAEFWEEQCHKFKQIESLPELDLESVDNHYTPLD